mgnify:CR=1 FL=1
MLKLNINGKSQQVDVEPEMPLLWVLRDQLGMTGTKFGCGIAQCGACTVLLEGRPVLSCITLAVECEGKQIQTVEGLADGERLSEIQEAFLDQGALQCGFCTPGFITTITAYLEENPDPTPEEAREAISGNLCRCGSYPRIFAATRAASGHRYFVLKDMAGTGATRRAGRRRTLVIVRLFRTGRAAGSERVKSTQDVLIEQSNK